MDDGWRTMWLMTGHGFYSIVERKPDERHVHPRRLRGRR
jgi:hypothetical protein